MAAQRDMRRHDRKLLWLTEPKLRFAHDQLLEDPKDGLTLFGPPPEPPAGVNHGVIGTATGIRQFRAWAARLQQAIPAKPGVTSSVTFPGFEATFRLPWPAEPRVSLDLSEAELDAALNITDAHQRVFRTVELYASAIRRWIEEEDAKVDLWFVVVSELLWRRCRPKSTVSKADGVRPEFNLSHRQALARVAAPDLFPEYNAAAEQHLYENHFHNQLKAKLLGCKAVTQLVRQTTIAPNDYLNRWGKPIRRLQDEATVAWNLATAAYYKAGAMPWKLAGIRDGVCYIGLVFKKTNNPADQKEACCGAQMFLHSGEGLVFKGAVGSWATERLGEFHLPKDQAADIVSKCVEAYRGWNGAPPMELFIHGRTAFDDEEIAGFRKAAPEGTSVNGVQIRRANDLKLFRDGRRAVLRGLALPTGARSAYLWTAGYIPELLTYPGREVPSPLRVKQIFGGAPLLTVLEDIVALTKVNFNACIYSDGLPVTLRFADDIGEILTAIPQVDAEPLPFRHYI